MSGCSAGDARASDLPHRYGTIVCDLERRRSVVLLPDREPATSEAWLRHQPVVHTVARDRGDGYGEAVSLVPRDGDPVVVDVNGERSIKIFRLSGGRSSLAYGNRDYPDYDPGPDAEIDIFGVVTNAVRRFRR